MFNVSMIKQQEKSNDMVSMRIGIIKIKFISPLLAGIVVSLLNESDIEIRLITQNRLLVNFTINSRDNNSLMTLGLHFENP